MGVEGIALLAITGLLSIIGNRGVVANRPPVVYETLNNAVMSEAAPVGSVLGRLDGMDPEGSPLHYQLSGTDHFQVDPATGVVTLVKPLDREVNDTLSFYVLVQDEVEGGKNNLVNLQISVIVADDNDNAPVFKNVPYEALVPEDTPVGTTIFSSILVEDSDLLGETLEVTCTEHVQFPNACAKFALEMWNASQQSYQGGIVLKQRLDYSERPFYQVLLQATDGVHQVQTGLQVKVQDVQNMPPVFVGSLTGVIREDDPIGTLVTTFVARDGDKGQPRKIQYELITNPLDYFLLDSETGELRTAKPLDREALPDSNGVISLTVVARELVDGMPSNDVMTSTSAVASITITDVNDEPPTFNQREYTVSLSENIPDGTPLPNLDMTVTDPYVGSNSAFSLRLADLSGAFAVEPKNATGSTSVSIRVMNGSLDYENPNSRKFILLVIAEETEAYPKHSSTATLTVEVTDANDNAPVFDQEVLAAVVSETASPGSVIANFTATDRDSGRFGTDGIVYSLVGDGADKFNVNSKTGVITVAPCDKPGAPECLDFETKPVYFLSYMARDDEGNGQSSVVPLKISLLDSNDNAPIFTSATYTAVIDEGSKKFEPPLQVQARDADKTSKIEYSIIEANENDLFVVDRDTGEVLVASPDGLDMSNATSDFVHLVIEASDGIFSSRCDVNITVLDVNNNSPIFERESYVATVKEDTPIGTSVEKVTALDADSGVNAELIYRIEKGAFDDFSIDNMTGVIRVESKLDFDRRSFYSIEIISVDGGTPALTGTTTVSLNIENSNDKIPFFEPPTQRAEVGEDASVGTIIHRLTAKDLDVNTSDALQFSTSEPITAVDKNGKEVSEDESFKNFFHVNKETGDVTVAEALRRDVASVVRITVVVTDITAPTLQQGKGTLVVTIIDVNDFAPTFPAPWTSEKPYYTIDILEEQPVGTLIGTFTATDQDSNIERYEILPPSKYFSINNSTGAVRTMERIDYEETPSLNFTIVAFDSGVPQLSSSAHVMVNVVNINDNDPVFNQSSYAVKLYENAPQGTVVARVKATDKDSGVFGEVAYSLIGEHSSEFSIDSETGEITVARSTALDREERDDVTLQVMASDGAPNDIKRTTAVPVSIKLLDVNDNAPSFTQRNYVANIVENIPLSPPSPIVQLRAQDKDQTSQLKYRIISGNVGDVFKLDPVTGILTPGVSLVGKPQHFSLTVEVSDGTFTDAANVDIKILNVNQHQPTFIEPPSQNATIHVEENDIGDTLVMRVRAEDEDYGENGRVTYHFKVNDSNVQETEEFSIDADNGELRAKVILDRETKPSYQLVLVARDHASPTWYEALQFLTIILKDVDDNVPEFPSENSTKPYIFNVIENTPSHRKIGKVEAVDKDEGENAKVYYYIIGGNEDRRFVVDRLDGTIWTNGTLDREEQDSYQLYIKATNDPDYYASKDKNAANNLRESSSVAKVRIVVMDENDNPPVFEKSFYFAGVNVAADEDELVCELFASDLDEGENGVITYQIVASHLFRGGSNVSSGSVVPSPFRISNAGRLKTATLVAEYNQERFQLDVVAREKTHPFREAKATVWIYEDQQLIRVILSKTPEEVNRDKDKIVSILSNATRSLVVVDDIKYHIDDLNHKHEDWCDMYLHVVDQRTFSIAMIPDILKVIDAQYDYLKDYYVGNAIENVIPAHVNVRDESFDPAVASLIALLVVLFVGCVSVIIVCCCFRHWVVAEPMDMKASDMLIKKAILDDLNTTENPLWIEQKLKLYEEQELTMQVFCEPDSTQMPTQATMERRDSADMSVVDNTYDTIQHPARRGSVNTVLSLGAGDYATLGGSLLPIDNVSSHSQQMYEAALGFQGSTFQVPESGDLFRTRSELRVNKDGQPEFVSELI
ncbi:hypothetical protein LSTR_LSTR009658 [Laodelphax striatellus]|uniref:Cadherin domain-containing protein n=1 Tax=Laodelphax striatellus TaxID=195883 RepID=A0A482WP59_LAOST|nr:hypothetical protein LSTR_LSTR009658 [Laodelphax striatellus]